MAFSGQYGVYVCSDGNPFYTSNLSNTEIQAIANVSGDTWKYTLESGADLSEVLVGNIAHFSGCTNSANNGDFVITDVNDGSDYIEVTNANSVAQVAAGGTARTTGFPKGAYASVKAAASVATAEVDNSYGDSLAGSYAVDSLILGPITELTITALDSGVVHIYFEGPVK